MQIRRWVTVIFVVVVIVALVLGGSLQLIFSLLLEEQKQGILPFIGAIGITVVVANAIIAIMQWFGISPLDYLPEKTLREKDPKRFKLAQSRDPKVLEDVVGKAIKLGEYDWAELFAEAWVNINPGKIRAYEDLARAVKELNQPNKLKDIGNRLISLHKLNYRGYEILGEAHSQLAEWEDARKWYERALVYAPETFRQSVLSNLQEVYEALGLIDPAIETTNQLIDLVDDEFRKVYQREKLEHLKLLAARLGPRQETN